MKNHLIIFGILFFTLLAVGVGKAYAGGCCYKYFFAVDGVAGVKDVQINVAFVDPRTYTGPLNDQKIDVHVMAAKPGQYCLPNSEKTDGDGHIAAHCTSPHPGALSIYFTAPDLNDQANEAIKSVPKSITFAANPNAPAVTPSPIPIASPLPVKTHKAAPTPIVKPSPSPVSTSVEQNVQENTVPDTAKLQEQIDSLTEKVQAQEKQVSALQKAITSLQDFFKKLFHN